MSDILHNRWKDDPLFSKAKEILLSDPSRIEPNKRREWYKDLPKIKHPFDEESADFRCLTLDQAEIGKIWLCYVLDDSTAKGATFLGTRFQGASIKACDFTGAHFEIAQMSPVFAELAIFRNCQFDRSFLMATDIYGQKQGTFRKCDFSGVRAYRTDWNWSDLGEAKMSYGVFEQCDFSRCNLVDCEIENTKFLGCNFAFADVTDSIANRRSLAVGGNKGIDLIQWHCSNS